MEKRTANIIMVCKGHHNFGENLTLKQAVAHYMSKTCDCPIEVYTDQVLRGIVYEAFADYMSSCSFPREILHTIREALYWCDWTPREGVDDITAVLIGFQLCQVKDKTEYINGFNKDLANHELIE